MKFNIEYKNPKDLVPYKLNAKTHPEEQIRLIKHSIDTFQMDQPIVIDENNVIIKGHGRRLAAMELGHESVPVIVRMDLTEAEKRAARIADNKTAESAIDMSLLQIDLSELQQMDFDVTSLGFEIALDEPDEPDDDEDGPSDNQSESSGKNEKNVPLFIEISKADHKRFKNIKKENGLLSDADVLLKLMECYHA